MSQLILVRHGITQWNEEKRIQGRLNIPLTTKGKHQVSLLVPFLRPSKSAVVVSSPTARALESAEIIANSLGLRLVVDADFVEFDVGEWQGKTEGDLARISSWKTYRLDPTKADPNGGESMAHVRERVLHGFQTILEFPEDDKIIVTHGDVIRILVCYLTGRPFRGMHEIDIPLASAVHLTLTNPQTAVISSTDAIST